MEKQKQIRISIALLVVAVCSILYSQGGVTDMGGKCLRRYLVPLLYFASAYGFTRNWKVLIGLPFSVLGLSLGYGADVTAIKILKRVYTSGICSLSFGYKWLWALIPITLVTILGVLNPLPARLEEMAIGFIYCLPLLQIAYKGDRHG